jgi:Flp pilus assembly protein TadD
MAKNARLRRERLLEAARGYLAIGMADHALQQLDTIEDPENCAFDWHQLRAEALRDQGNYVAALESYNRALSERPRDVAVLMGMAWCYKRTDRLRLSIAAMQQAYRVAPDEPVVLYNLACYYSLAGEKTQALSWLGRALRMHAALRKCIPDETDFDPLRDDPDFQFVSGLSDALEGP